MGLFKPTEEQQAIIDKSKGSSVMVIDAGAGCAKTTTLAMVAEENEVQSLLLVFGKQAEQDSRERFPSHVEVRTTHSMAYRSVGRKYQHKLNRPRGTYVNVVYTGGEIAKHFKIKGVEFPDKKDDKKNKYISPAGIGFLVRRCVELFEQSDSEEFKSRHIPKEAKNKCISDLVLGTAEELWNLRVDKRSKVLISHDTYMKLYQLSKPILPHKIIYLDEAQDTSECTLDIVKRQMGHSKVVIVGDKRQAIFGWRGSVNAMKLVEGVKMILSESFRFGPKSSEIANRVLGQTGLKSAKGIETIVGSEEVVDKTSPYTVLFRTNIALLVQALEDIGLGKKVNLEINTKDLCKQLQDAVELYGGNLSKVKHESLLMFNYWGELQEEGKYNPEINRIVKLVESGEVDNVLKSLKGHKNCKVPEITMTTAHKSKGREWAQVILGDDFPSSLDREGNWVGLHEFEENLLYVALTRARDKLEYNDSVLEIINRGGV